MQKTRWRGKWNNTKSEEQSAAAAVWDAIACANWNADDDDSGAGVEVRFRISYYNLVRTLHLLLAVASRVAARKHANACSCNVVFHRMKMDGRRLTMNRFKFIMEMISPRTFRGVVVRVSQTHLIIQCVCATRCMRTRTRFYSYYVYGENEIMTFNVDDFLFATFNL